ncbi:MAG: hypothetical protein U1A78_20170 [Polyangia bacterium]
MDPNRTSPPPGPPAGSPPAGSPPAGSLSAGSLSSEAPHPLLQALHREAAAPREGAPAGPLLDGLRVLGAVLIVELCLSLVLSALAAQQMEALIHHRPDEILLPVALRQVALGGLRLLLVGAGVAVLYALSLIARASSEVRGRLYIALAAGGVDLLMSLGFLLVDFWPLSRALFDLDSLMSVRVSLSAVASLADVIGAVALFESLLSLRGQPRPLSDAQARALFWGLLIGRYALSYLPAMSGPLWRETSQWLWFGLRALVRTGGTALILLLVREAIEQALTATATAAPGAAASEREGADGEALRSQGARNLFFGILWCLGGLAVTLWSYQSAHASRTGGRYVIVYGAILAGIAQAVRGLIQLGRAR